MTGKFLLDTNAVLYLLYIKIRKAYNLKLPDAIIAATAIVCKVPLISADKIFERITELDFIKLEILE